MKHNPQMSQSRSDSLGVLLTPESTVKTGLNDIGMEWNGKSNRSA